MVKSEYLRFLQTLNKEGVSSGVRKIANLVIENLDEIVILGTAQGKRAKKIAELASISWSEVTDVIEDIEDEIDDDDEVVKQLKSIKIGPFRGFAKEELLELNSLLVLIYGPNGSGKSSFCEALEYGLLGSVDEAQSKRFTNQLDYLKNAHINKFVAPLIEGINSKDESTIVLPNEALYRFCFVEKNRIDNFSRIAAHAPARQTELISSLFGLEGFNGFVKNFSPEIDDRYIDLVGIKSSQLIEAQKKLGIHNLTIENNRKSLVTQTEKETKLANELKPETTYAELVVVLGTDEKPGRIQALESELQIEQPLITNLSGELLKESKEKVESTHQELSEKLVELAKVSEGLSFKQLYGALLELQEVNDDNCPACKTPLNQVMKDPYELANVELEKLGHLTQLEHERDHLKTEFIKAVKSIYMMVKTCVEQIDIDINVNSLNLCLVEDEESLGWVWWKSLEPGSAEMASYWWLLKQQVKKLEQRDVDVNKASEERDPKQERLGKLRQIEKGVIKLQTERETIDDATKKAEDSIAAFDEENKELIKAVKAEKAVVVTNHQIATSYGIFVKKLSDYKEGLPRKLIADLGDLVVKLYNAFNRNDASKDLLADIKLPMASGQRIEIAYRAKPDKFFDALHIFSEGHIRCIGLAILLAKNIKTNSPFLIFDDPINAIDDEHRSAIRETLFKDDYFKKKQIILACHGEEFFKNTHQTIGKKAAEESESYIFSPQNIENHIQVNSMKRAKNYVLSAVEFLEKSEYRDALMSSRRALEYLCEKSWFHYGTHSGKTDPLISVSRRSPDAPWDLRNLAENLKSKINKSKANIPNSVKIVGAFETLLGQNGQDPHWLYLNKGTHEENDREEFDHAIVQNIVRSLVLLDEALS